MATIDRLPSAVTAVLQDRRTNAHLVSVEVQIDPERPNTGETEKVTVRARFVATNGDEVAAEYGIDRETYRLGSNDAAVTQRIAVEIVRQLEKFLESAAPGSSRRPEPALGYPPAASFSQSAAAEMPPAIWPELCELMTAGRPSASSNPCGEIALGAPEECPLEAPGGDPTDVGEGEWIDHVMIVGPDGRGGCVACGRSSAEIGRLDRGDRCAEVLDGTVVRWYGDPAGPSQGSGSDPETDHAMAEDGCECRRCREARAIEESAEGEAMAIHAHQVHDELMFVPETVRDGLVRREDDG